VGDKIVVMSGKVSSVEKMEKDGIDWDDLQYARAIIIDGQFENWEKEEIFNPKLSISNKRVKAIAAEKLGLKRSELEGTQITIDYTTGNVYKGDLKV
jgi:hypothetical protein